MHEKTLSLLCRHGLALRSCSVCQSAGSGTHAGLSAQPPIADKDKLQEKGIDTEEK